jgi:nitroimidazol reductase NimA-like FMN-containing flavoprotein (pyridoxamine 5'-phosphate oxidase superfamily)
MEASGWAADATALNQFLAEPNLGRVATVDLDGQPHVVPAWVWWDGESFWVGAQASDHKVANIRRTGRGGVEVDADIRRRRGVYATGRAIVLDGAEGRREYIRITAEQVPRYQPGKPPLETARAYGEKGTPVVIRIVPERLISWGR